MNKKNEIRDELKKLSPFLSDIKKENVFKVPENYFKALPDKVLEQVQTTTKDSRQNVAHPGWIERLMENIAVLFQPKYAVGFATAMILIIASVYFIQKPNDQIDESYQLVSQYVSDNIDEFDVEMLWEASAFENDESTIKEGNKDVNSDEYFDEIIDGMDDSELEKLL